MASLLIFLLAAALWAGLVVFFRTRRIWLLYYVTASAGLALLLLYAGTQLIPLERWLEYATAYCAHIFSQGLGVPTRVFEAAPGNILVWIVIQNPGWVVVRVDLECSGLLEQAALTGLVFFYPAWSLTHRAGLTLIGWLVTFAANIIRVLVVILLLHLWGKNAIFIAHTVVGRLVFFVLVSGVYWFILTRGTLRVVENRLKQRMHSSWNA